MKPELRNLLDRLQAHPRLEQFQSLVISANGSARAVFRHGCIPFETLDELEHFAYPDQPQRTGLATEADNPLARGAAALAELVTETTQLSAPSASLRLPQP